MNIAALQVADARPLEAFPAGRLVEIGLFDANDTVVFDEPRMYLVWST